MNYSHRSVVWFCPGGCLKDIIISPARQIFPEILRQCGEETITLIDKLNRLEKLGYLHDAQWWSLLKDLRNELSHDYPEESLLMETNTHEIFVRSKELVKFWDQFTPKLAPFIR